MYGRFLMFVSILLIVFITLIIGIFTFIVYRRLKNPVARRIAAIALVGELILALGIGIARYCYIYVPANVFEEIYIDRVYQYKSSPMLYNTSIGAYSQDTLASLWNRGECIISGYSTVLDSPMEIVCHQSPRKIEFVVCPKTSETDTSNGEDRYYYTYTYDFSTKELTYFTTNPSNEDAKKFLYDDILNDWVTSNEGVSRFTMDDLGDFEFVE